jgi:hypothetical protein
MGICWCLEGNGWRRKGSIILSDAGPTILDSCGATYFNERTVK